MMREITKWKLIQEEDISPSKWFPLFKHTVELPNGIKLNDYYISKLGHVAMMIPITKDGRFVFVKQYKHGIQSITIEFPAGIIESHQSPIEAAFSELKQETGIQSDQLIFLGELYTLPSKNFSTLYGYLATDAEVTIPQELDETEEIEILFYTEEEVKNNILNGLINCSDTIALFTLYMLKRQSTQEK